MSNDSSTGGYLAPADTPAPLEGDALLDFLQEVLVGITGMDGKLVRPRYQAEPPNIPTAGTSWCAFGILRRDPDTYPSIVHDKNLPGDRLQRNEVLELLCSFYDLGDTGEADALASRLRDGIQIEQNLAALEAADFVLVDTGTPLTVPSMLKERWQYRVDLPLTLARQVNRTYPILNVASAQAELRAEDPAGHVVVDETITVTP